MRIRFLLTGVAAALSVGVPLTDGAVTSAARTRPHATDAQTRTLPPFTAVNLAGENDVIVHVGGAQKVVVHAASYLQDRVTTVVRSGQLVIGLRPGTVVTRKPFYVSVTMPTLDSLTLSGAGTINASGIRGSSITIDVPGSGSVTATGTTTTLTASLGGTGNAALSGLKAVDAKATLAGNGIINVTATQRLTAALSGNGTIVYGGSPSDVVKSITGFGAILSTG